MKAFTRKLPPLFFAVYIVKRVAQVHINSKNSKDTKRIKPKLKRSTKTKQRQMILKSQLKNS
jgi:hypothetical protein